MTEMHHNRHQKPRYLFQHQVPMKWFHWNQTRYTSYASQNQLIPILLSIPETKMIDHVAQENAVNEFYYLQPNTWNQWRNIVLDGHIKTPSRLFCKILKNSNATFSHSTDTRLRKECKTKSNFSTFLFCHCFMELVRGNRNPPTSRPTLLYMYIYIDIYNRLRIDSLLTPLLHLPKTQLLKA